MIYDEFQKKAIQSIDSGNSVIVSAPTGAGKTAIAEYVIGECLSTNKSAVYTAPIKALSNQKFRDFTHTYRKNIGILTGDVCLNTHAPILIMTTEIFRNTLLESPQRFKNTSWVIFDEIHYIDDPERGTVWEESIIFCPKHIRILALSATIPNVEQIALWIKKIHKHPIDTVIEKSRPVPLQHNFQAYNKIFSNINQLKKNVYSDHKTRSFPSRYKYKQKQRYHFNKITSLLMHLKETNKMPTIYFSFNRKRCEDLAYETKNFNFINENEKNKLPILFDELLKNFDLQNEPSALKLYPLIVKGIAYHHAGLLPSLKEVIERLFTSRLIKLIYTTETFALGINMPAKTVIFDNLRKFYGNYHANLRCRDYYQMAGRAGRRGMDVKGFVYSRINPHRIEISQVKNIIFGQPEPVISQFNISYASLLHVYQRWEERLYEVYPLTLHFFQSNKKMRKNAFSLLHTKIKLLKDMGYINKNKLTDKGQFASSVYGYELPITELFYGGILEHLSSIELNIVLSAFVFEPRKHQIHIKLPNQILKTQKRILSKMDYILKREKKYKIRPLSKKPYFNLAQTIEKWSHGENLATIKNYTSADEGEIVRCFRMVIQILRQLHTIRFISPDFKQTVQQALNCINRNEIDAEKQLRAGL